MEQALRALKKKMQREGIFREMKLRRHHETESEKKKRRDSESERRRRKLDRKRYQMD
ncbi:MAG: ribosomal protein [Rickettsiaceae bacterium]|jgi:small subunit ribosomal protein S21|nr:ribosomal protein [Rickettsiaceae bacterium]